MRALPVLSISGLLALVCSTGCGLKGPLYLPTAEQRREAAEREAALAERERRERAAPPAASAQPAPERTPSQPDGTAAPAN